MTGDNQDELMMQAASMYYQEDMTQAEIARELFFVQDEGLPSA